MGIQFGVALTLFTLGGVWLDGRYPSVQPLFTILGFLLGAGGGMASLVYGVSNDKNGTESKR